MWSESDIWSPQRWTHPLWKLSQVLMMEWAIRLWYYFWTLLWTENCTLLIVVFIILFLDGFKAYRQSLFRCGKTMACVLDLLRCSRSDQCSGLTKRSPASSKISLRDLKKKSWRLTRAVLETSWGVSSPEDFQEEQEQSWGFPRSVEFQNAVMVNWTKCVFTFNRCAHNSISRWLQSLQTVGVSMRKNNGLCFRSSSAQPFRLF